MEFPQKVGCTFAHLLHAAARRYRVEDVRDMSSGTKSISAYIWTLIPSLSGDAIMIREMPVDCGRPFLSKAALHKTNTYTVSLLRF
jgi:hypothetical protein